MAEYTTIDDVDLPAISREYDLGDASASVLRGGAANSSFTVRSDAGTFVLTVLDNHDAVSARRLADVTDAMCRLGVETSEIVRSADGSLITEINQRPAILKKWIDGSVLDPVPLDLLETAGATLASVHEVPTGIGALPTRTRRLSPQQESHIDRFTDRDFATWLTSRLDRVRDARGTMPDAVTHGDLFPDNLIVRPDRSLVVIDWETASLDDPLLDLGMAIVGLARVDDHVDDERMHHLIGGYTAVRPLSDNDLAILPDLAEYAALVIAFHRYYRHNVRFPNPDRAQSHRPIMRVIESMEAIRV